MLPKHLADDTAVERFNRETQLTGVLQHPAIPPVVERGELADGSPYLTMKLVEGETLARILSKRRSDGSDLPRLLGVFEQIAQAVGYAHSQRVIHRDLKPANIMVGAFGELQVMDWGMAKRIGESEPGELPVAEQTPSDPESTVAFLMDDRANSDTHAPGEGWAT